MKKAISLFAVLSMCIALLPHAFAASAAQMTGKTVETASVYDVSYQITTEQWTSETGENYSVITVKGGGDVSIYDTRNNYITQNGEVIHITATPVNTSNISLDTAGVRPTSIDHGLGGSIAPRWQYMYSNWVQYKVETTIVATTVSTLIGLVTKLGFVAAAAYSIYAGCSTSDNAFYDRTYWYGDSYVMGRTGYVSQLYTQNYTPLYGDACSMGPGLTA